MVDLRTGLMDTGMATNDQTFYEYVTYSIPTSFDLFITLYEDPTYDVNVTLFTFTTNSRTFPPLRPVKSAPNLSRSVRTRVLP